MTQFHFNTKISKSGILNLFLTLILWVNFFFSFFPAHRGSVLWDILPNEEAYSSIWIKMLTFFNFGCSILFLLIQRKIRTSNILIFLFLLWFLFLISKASNSFNGNFLAVIAIPVEYLLFYVILKDYSFSKSCRNKIIFLSAIWIALPLFLFIVGSPETKLSFISFDHGRLGTYGGFALHRNFFGFYAGLMVLVTLFSDISKGKKIFLLIIGIISIFISASRSAFLCLLIAVSFFTMLTYKKWRIPFLILIGSLGIIYYSLSQELELRSGDITSNSDREELYQGFTDSISTHPFFGKGVPTVYYSPTYPNGSPAHNFILQTSNDYGIIVLISFCLFWGVLFIYGNRIVKTFLIFLISFGLFQPYFMFNIPSPFVWMCILSICLVSKTPRLHPVKLTYMKNGKLV